MLLQLPFWFKHFLLRHCFFIFMMQIFFFNFKTTKLLLQYKNKHELLLEVLFTNIVVEVKIADVLLCKQLNLDYILKL